MRSPPPSAGPSSTQAYVLGEGVTLDRRPRMSPVWRTHAPRRARHRGGVRAPLPPRPRRRDRGACSGTCPGTSVLEESCAAKSRRRGVGGVATEPYGAGSWGRVCSGSCDLGRTGLGVGLPPHEGGWEGQQGGATREGGTGAPGKRAFETPTLPFWPRTFSSSVILSAASNDALRGTNTGPRDDTCHGVTSVGESSIMLWGTQRVLLSVLLCACDGDVATRSDASVVADGGKDATNDVESSGDGSRDGHTHPSDGALCPDGPQMCCGPENCSGGYANAVCGIDGWTCPAGQFPGDSCDALSCGDFVDGGE